MWRTTFGNEAGSRQVTEMETARKTGDAGAIKDDMSPPATAECAVTSALAAVIARPKSWRGPHDSKPILFHDTSPLCRTSVRNSGTLL